MMTVLTPHYGGNEIKIHKLIECGFIWEGQHPDWVTNIVHVLKKNNKIRVCTDFNLFQGWIFIAYHWHYDWQHMWLQKDILYGWLFRVQSNQDVPRWWKAYVIMNTVGVYYDMVMPFRFKNAGATYQYAISMIFCDHLREMVECYIDTLWSKVVAKTATSTT